MLKSILFADCYKPDILTYKEYVTQYNRNVNTSVQHTEFLLQWNTHKQNSVNDRLLLTKLNSLFNRDNRQYIQTQELTVNTGKHTVNLFFRIPQQYLNLSDFSVRTTYSYHFSDASPNINKPLWRGLSSICCGIFNMVNRSPGNSRRTISNK